MSFGDVVQQLISLLQNRMAPLDSLPATNRRMRAAVLTALGGSVRLEDIAVPRPGRGQVLFKIAASGVCFTDIKVGQALAAKTPLVPGHEPVGVVHTLGDGVAGRRQARVLRSTHASGAANPDFSWNVDCGGV
ncbi:MAG: hypothetical protein E6R06_31285 [Mycobacterium sp.]|jgi:propanol-preferring alcohol dehydrogenase|nr:MAG: hypothetical protein E6R06_31285 [Mycobacterium sp.]